MKSIEPIESFEPIEEHPLESEGTTDLIRKLFDDAQTLINEELRLAKLQMAREARRAKSAGIALGAGAALGLAGLIVVSFALVFVLALAMPLWASALIVGVVLSAAALIALKVGKKRLARVHPERAVEPIIEEGRWIKQTVEDIRSQRPEHTLH